MTVVGLALQDPGTRATVEQQVLAAFPSCHAQEAGGGTCQIISALDDFRKSTGVLAIVGILGLTWTGAGLFGAMEKGLNSLYPCTPRGFVAQKLMSMGMVATFTVMAVPLVASGSLLALLQSLPGVPDFLRSSAAGLLIQVAAGIVDASLLFGVIYFVVPHRKQRLRGVIPGAIAAGVLFETLTLVFPLYFRLVTNSPQWGQTFGFVFVLLFYFYLLGQIIILGGALNAEIDTSQEAHAKPRLKSGGLGGKKVLSEPEAPAP